jgi:hypothetical protein
MDLQPLAAPPPDPATDLRAHYAPPDLRPRHDVILCDPEVYAAGPPLSRAPASIFLTLNGCPYRLRFWPAALWDRIPEADRPDARLDETGQGYFALTALSS